MEMRKRALVLWVIFLALVGLALPAAGTPWGEDYFPNVPLVTQDGEEVRFFDFMDSPMVCSE